MKKSIEKILAEMDYVRNIKDEKASEVKWLEKKLLKLEKELAIATRVR